MANYTAKIILSFPVEANTAEDAWRIAHYSALAFVNGSQNAEALLEDYGNVEQPEYDFDRDGGVQIYDEAGNTLLVDGDSVSVNPDQVDIEAETSSEPEDTDSAVTDDNEETPDSE